MALVPVSGGVPLPLFCMVYIYTRYDLFSLVYTVVVVVVSRCWWAVVVAVVMVVGLRKRTSSRVSEKSPTWYWF